MASRVYSSLRYMSFGGFSCCRAWAVVIQASVVAGFMLSGCSSCSVGAAHGFNHCAACWIFPDEGLNLCPLHCQVDPHLPGKSWKSHLFRTVNEILLLLSFIHYIYIRRFFFKIIHYASGSNDAVLRRADLALSQSRGPPCPCRFSLWVSDLSTENL